MKSQVFGALAFVAIASSQEQNPTNSLHKEKRIPLSLRLPNPRPRDDPIVCPCADTTLCEVVSHKPDREIFGFDTFAQWNEGKGYDFDTITTIAWGEGGGDLICTAHAKNVRVIASTNPPRTGNQDDIDSYIQATILSMKQNFYDGITFDWEDAVEGLDDPVNAIYVDVIDQTNKALKAVNPNYQTSVCAAWSPLGIDGRFYDYKSLATATDYLYVMCYDTRSQIFYQCVASANAPITVCQKGIQDFLELGIPASKLILGIPWYGYRYECVNEDAALDNPHCELAQVPFRGVNCSDACGSQQSYSGAQAIIRDGDNGTSTKGPVWRDPYLNVQFFNYIMHNDENQTMYQTWIDDVVSLSEIYKWVKEMNLGGTGPYTWSYLDSTGPGEQQALDMWEALKLAI
tara:strand:+ start:235 stop:1440 length:1206 start_codon:yes stop_codon:yes gene_type:complete